MNLNFKIPFVLLLVIQLVFGCNKDQVTSPTKDITGQWKWIFTYKVYPLSDSNPLTPQNTGIQELIVFNANHTWYKTQNSIKTDSGTYLLGHGSYTPYTGAHTFIYDSISYYQNGIHIVGWQDYYDIFNDTLEFNPYYSAR